MATSSCLCMVSDRSKASEGTGTLLKAVFKYFGLRTHRAWAIAVLDVESPRQGVRMPHLLRQG